MKQQVVVSGLLLQNGKALLIQRSQREAFLPGYFELPGGKVDSPEDPMEALKREFWEETGLRVDVGKPIRTFSYQNKEKHYIEIIYQVHSVDTEILLSEDHSDFVWVDHMDQLHALTLSDEVKKTLLPYIISGESHPTS